MRPKYAIPFNRPTLIGKELVYIQAAHHRRQLAGDGVFTKKVQAWLESHLGSSMSLLTHSATAAIEMMAMLSDLKAGDEIIMPSYTFVSTANAFALQKAKPVFIDIRPDTLNINEQLIEQAITKKTKAIVPVHYAGVGCDMDTIMAIAKKYKLLVLEDAAQGFLAKYKNKYLGTIGDLAAFSFHETKNIISGEGGALMINNPRYSDRAQIVREKGTNRTQFFNGKVDKYTWVDLGSSYLPGEIIASFLLAQLEKSKKIHLRRMALWNRYHQALSAIGTRELVILPHVPNDVEHNGHIFYLLTKNRSQRDSLIQHLANKNILAVTHYVPLHTSPAGKKYARYVKPMNVTDRIAETLVRLPMYYDLSFEEQDKVIDVIFQFYRKL